MRISILFGAVLYAGSLAAAEKPQPPAIASTSNNLVEVTARAIVDPAEVTATLGMQPPYPMVLLDVKVRTREEESLRIDRDDFTLVSARDGQRSQPLEPSQIAGKGALVISSTSRGAIAADQARGPVWGGIGGAPQTMGGNGAVLGSGPGETKIDSRVDKNSPESPILAVLKQRIMPNAETNEQVTGLLYFLFDGKTPKAKDLTLIYKGAGGGRLLLEFNPKK